MTMKTIQLAWIIIILLLLPSKNIQAKNYGPQLLWKYYTGGILSSISIAKDVIAIGTENKIYLLSNSGRPLWSYWTGEPVCVALSSDARYVAVSSGYKVYFFDRQGRLLWSYKTGGDVNGVALSSDARYVAVSSGYSDYIVYFFDRQGRLLWSYKTVYSVNGVALSSDARYVAAGSRDGYLYFFPVMTNNPPVAGFSFKPSHPTDLDVVRFTDESYDPDGRIVRWLWDLSLIHI